MNILRLRQIFQRSYKKIRVYTTETVKQNKFSPFVCQSRQFLESKQRHRSYGWGLDNPIFLLIY